MQIELVMRSILHTQLGHFDINVVYIILGSMNRLYNKMFKKNDSFWIKKPEIRLLSHNAVPINQKQSERIEESKKYLFFFFSPFLITSKNYEPSAAEP